jgi:hypothetical protein
VKEMASDSGKLIVRNPLTGETKVIGPAFLWCLLFGTIYFLYHGAMKQAAISIVVVLFTGGLAWLVYPFFARGILKNHYLLSGWEQLSPDGHVISSMVKLEQPKPAEDSVASQLAKLSAIKQSGDLSQEEYDQLKAKILASE